MLLNMYCGRWIWIIFKLYAQFKIWGEAWLLLVEKAI